MDYYDAVPLGRSFRLAEPKDFNLVGPKAIIWPRQNISFCRTLLYTWPPWPLGEDPSGNVLYLIGGGKHPGLSVSDNVETLEE
ncbi:MAG: hypothetical protein M3495_15175 [Pseudomonadota bacterium]|nr:hypothetical protein [Gammaproteobacteria bacterium]MDQ3582855.1 hypothetical protein [Pseudomonadota bacterium]